VRAPRLAALLLAVAAVAAATPSQGLGATATLDVALTGAGTVVISSVDPSGLPHELTCPPDCTAGLELGSIVTITPGGGSTIAEWGGACAGTPADAPCTFSLDGSATVDVIFADATVTILKTGSGTGVVEFGNGTTYACGSICSATFPAGSSVTAVVRPDPGSAFTGWTTGPCAPLVAACTFTLPSIGATLTATFTATDTRCTIIGTASPDVISGTPAADWICALGGDDAVHGGAGNDVILGGAGQDRLVGDTGNDLVFGGDGDDELLGTSGADSLFGGTGADSMRGGSGFDFGIGAPGPGDVCFPDVEIKLFC
jgi:Ca2+-binding RTX toxin-like protein